MVYVSKVNAIINDYKGNIFPIPLNFIGEVPQWVEKNWYFQALCKDNLITAAATRRDRDLDKANEVKPDLKQADLEDEKEVIDVTQIKPTKGKK